MEFRKLTPRDSTAFLAAYEATKKNDPNFSKGFTEGMTFDQYLALLDATERGENLPPDHVPSTIYFAFIGDEIAGRLMFRHHLNDRLLKSGGHLGYVVLERHRGRGIATELLRRGLELAKARGIDRVLLTCDEKNAASRRVIEKHRGVLEDIQPHPDSGVPFCRYWITL
ncbi:MAG: GNAT family N-acetyltransferase [Myxococcaceae bacterium]